MGAPYFRDGRIYSAMTRTVLGFRTLVGATAEQIWGGTSLTRPSPGGIQLQLVSSSVQDDSVKRQRDTITIAGTMNPATKDKWTCTLAGGVNTGDIARLTLNGTNYDTEVTPALNTLALLSAEVATSGNSGTWDTWKIVPGGTLNVGDIITLTVPGDAAPYTYTVAGGNTATDVATALKNAVNANGAALYTASSFTSNLTLTKKTRGVGVAITCTWTTDPGLDATVTTTHTVTGLAGQTAWTVTTNGVSAVIAEHATAGVTADTVASSYAVDPGANSTFTAVHTVTGAAADILAVSDGTTTFSRTVASAVLATEVAALAALIDASALYTATSVDGVVTVNAATPGTGFTFANASTDNQTADLTVTIANVIANGAGTGVQAVRLDYLDSNGAVQSETVSMDGTATVNTVATGIVELLGVAASSVGSNGSAVGTITIKDTGGATTYESIAAGFCEALAAIYKVPARHRAFIYRTDLSASVASQVAICSDCNPLTGAVVANGKFTWAIATVSVQTPSNDLASPIGPFPANAKVWAEATGGAGRIITASICTYLESVS